MLETIRMHVVVPLFGRLGTMAATALMPVAATSDLAHQVGIGVTAVGLVAFDLVVSYLNRRATAARVFNQTVEGMLTGQVK